MYFLAFPLDSELFWPLDNLTVMLCLYRQDFKAPGEKTRDCVCQALSWLRLESNFFQIAEGCLFLRIIYYSFSGSGASLTWKTHAEEVSTPLLWPLLSPWHHPPPWVFLADAGAGSPWPHVGFFPYSLHLCLSETWGSSQMFSFDLDQPLFLVSWLLELPGEDGSEGDILSSLIGKQLGVPGKPGKDKISKL